jgi:hypothetical protein
MRPLLVLCLCLLPTAARAASTPPTAFRADPRTVQRFGAGYRYTQAGWIVLHIEGEPYERGVQHGRLLAPEIAAHARCYAAELSSKSPAQGWKLARTLASALFLRGYAKEYLEEMKGIADGASAAGARFDGRRLDVLDVVTLNAWPEIDTLDSALNATPTGLEGIRFGLKTPMPKPAPKPMRCSAFAATGPATRDGKIVFGHITMFKLYPSNFYNVWLDVKPARGHRVLMQSFPAGIHSGMDYYQNDAGLLICETTIGQTRFHRPGVPLASRIRSAMQYADSIEKAVAILEKDNNGLYTNEWLLGDVKTNEIAMFELGTHKTRLRRSSKNEWFGDTPGFYWGCNNTKDLQVRLETIASTSDKPRGALFVPSERDKKWLELYDRYKGKMDVEFGKLAFTTPPLAAFSSVDAKFTTTDMARRLESWAVFGPPLGRTWHPRFDERSDFPEVRSLVSNPWTVLGGCAQDNGKDSIPVVDRHDPAGSKLPAFSLNPEDPPIHMTPAWRGTLLPKTDGDIWLATAFPAYERYVALEKALRSKSDKKELDSDARDRLAVALFAYRAMYEQGARSRPEPALVKVRANLHENDWHKVAQGKGVLLLHTLRGTLGAEVFDKMMDDFGTANAGKPVSTKQFLVAVEKAWKPVLTDESLAGAEKALRKSLAWFLDEWLHKTGLPSGRTGGPFTVLTFYPDIERTLIVYGTKDEEAANREAAEDLRKALLRRGANVDVPIRADDKVTDKELASHHLLLVGRPSTNRISERFANRLPVTFGKDSAVLRGKAYANADTALLVAAENPLQKRYSVVVIAGLGAASTCWAVEHFADRGGPPAGEVVILRRGKTPHALVVPADPVKVTSTEKRRGE